jgi:hypothetical protein
MNVDIFSTRKLSALNAMFTIEDIEIPRSVPLAVKKNIAPCIEK